MTKNKNNLGKNHTHLLAGVCTSVLVSAFACAVFASGDTNNGVGGSFTPVVQTELFTLADTYKSTDSGVKSGKRVRIEADGTGTAEDNVSKQNAQLNARLQLETGHIYDATTSLNSLLAKNPNDAQLLQMTANAENYGGNWPYASSLLSQAHSISPQNQDVSELLKEVRREHASGVQVDFDWIKYGHSVEDVTSVSASVNVAPHWGIGADVKENYVMGRDVRLSNGFVGDKNGNKEQGDIYALYSGPNGQLAKAAIYGNNDTAGGGLYYGFLSPLGQTTLTGEYKRPYWDLPEAVLDDATRDRIGFQHVIKPTTRLTLEGGADYNIYDVDNTSSVAKSITADVTVLYRLVDQVKYHKPFIDLGYNIDGEYVKSSKENVDSTGTTDRILPLISREIHTPYVEVGQEFTPSTYGDLAAGWQFDRLGGNGPMVQGKVTHEVTDMFDVQLRAGHSVEKAQSSNNITTVGGYVRCRF